MQAVLEQSRNWILRHRELLSVELKTEVSGF